MTTGDALNLIGQAILLVAKIAGPILVTTLIVGLVISLFQAVTSIQEFTLTFLPKLITVAAILAIAGHWMLGQLVDYTDQLYTSVPHLLAGS